MLVGSPLPGTFVRETSNLGPLYVEFNQHALIWVICPPSVHLQAKGLHRVTIIKNVSLEIL